MYKRNSNRKRIEKLVALVIIICQIVGVALTGGNANAVGDTNPGDPPGNLPWVETVGSTANQNPDEFADLGSGAVGETPAGIPPDNQTSVERPGSSAVQERKTTAFAILIDLAIKRAKEDVDSAYAEAEAVAVAEAKTAAEAARVAAEEAEKAAAAAKEAAAKSAAQTAAKAADTKTTSTVDKTDTNGVKIVYFTFDDGPSDLTDQYLDVFKKHGIKVTFFVIGKQAVKYPDQIKRMYAENHCIANHSYSHDYNAIYKSQSVLAAEMKKWDSTISDILGITYHSNVFRFPGGSTYSKAKQYNSYVKQLGYSYYDWTCLNGDAQISDRSADSLYKYMVSTYKNRDTEIVLFHDTHSKQTTLDMLDRAIQFFKDNGYEFRTLG